MERRGESNEPHVSSNALFAQVVVEDTVFSSYFDPELSQEATVQTCLAAVQGEDGDSLTQAMLASYGLSESAGEATGIPPALDVRMIELHTAHNTVVNVTSHGLREEIIAQLQAFLDLTPELKDAYLEALRNR
ncbi:MAG: hypothetical protein NUV98_03185 [Candidatus Roizmanbacteria bacterium]|nr:hypothetical protein [Candidatus Roizmanbacteria bacterium]